eukprot:1146558-Pelagomonas_calceolata.AAC.3
MLAVAVSMLVCCSAQHVEERAGLHIPTGAASDCGTAGTNCMHLPRSAWGFCVHMPRQASTAATAATTTSAGDGDGDEMEEVEGQQQQQQVQGQHHTLHTCSICGQPGHNACTHAQHAVATMHAATHAIMHATMHTAMPAAMNTATHAAMHATILH